LPIIIYLFEEKNVESLIDCAVIMNEICTLFGESSTITHFLPMISKLFEDSKFRVRKAIATNIANICKIIGQKYVIDVMVPIFEKLTEDKIWGVRKASIEGIIPIAQIVPHNIRKEKLSPIFRRLIEDPSRWVRHTAYKKLGEFIATYIDQPDLDHDFVDFFLSMGLEEKDEFFGDSDVAVYCAFNFPAILQTVGKDNWNELKPLYYKLSTHVQSKVRKSLAHSIHCVAQILGQQITENDLLSSFEAFLQDLEEVKIGVLNNISTFLFYLSINIRKKYVNLILQIHNSDNWRLRNTIAEQMDKFSSIFDSEIFHSKFVPIILELTEDPVAIIRDTIQSKMGDVIYNMQEDKEKRKFYKHNTQLLHLRFLSKENIFRKSLLFSNRKIAKPRSI